MNRVVERFQQRSLTRDTSIEADLVDLYQRDERDMSAAMAFVDPDNLKPTAVEGTQKAREHMVMEGVQQYRDYYESDAEEQSFFEYLDNLSNRDHIRFMEIFEDFSIDPSD